MEKEMNTGNINSKIISGIFVLGILGFLIISGSAQAFVLNLLVSDSVAEKGEIMNFTASVEMHDDEPLNIEHLIFRLKGPSKVQRNFDCKFFPNGTKDAGEGCKELNITVISISYEPPYGYDSCRVVYGYGYPNCNKKVKYLIRLNTGRYVAGIYETYLIVFDNNKKASEKRGADIIITGPSPILSNFKCSIRAFDGNLNVDSKKFTNNKINFNVYVRNGEVKGNGVLNGEKGKNRLNYRFKVEDILENDKTHAVFFVTGSYKLGQSERISENALITFDKVNNKIGIVGQDIDIKIMNINFREFC